MKIYNIRIVVIYLLLNFSISTEAQNAQTEDEKQRVTFSLAPEDSRTLSNNLNSQGNSSLINYFSSIFKNPNLTPCQGTTAGEIDVFGKKFAQMMSDITNKKENSAIIFIYRPMAIAKDEKDVTTVDFKQTKTFVYSKKQRETGVRNYLLNVKKVIIVLIDMNDDFYSLASPENANAMLSNTTFSIIRKPSFFKSSFTGLVDVWKGLGSDKINKSAIKVTFIEMNESKIKAPADLLGTNKAISPDILTFPIHELNIASFQIGVENAKYTTNNFAISSGNLVVTPSDQQKTSWKSNLFALLEIHVPRDIDNFNPILKDLFGKGRCRSFGDYLYDLFVERIGIYGGIKIAKDPISNIYSGINYALSKELSLNLGWKWSNEIVPQVTSIGDIMSIDDALKYAKRKYTNANFSIGLSFAPSVIASELITKSK